MEQLYAGFTWVTTLGGGGILAIALFLLGLLFRVGLKSMRSKKVLTLAAVSTR